MKQSKEKTMDVKDILKFQFVTGMGHVVNDQQKGTADQIILMACQAIFMLLIGFADSLAEQISIIINWISQYIKSMISSSNFVGSIEKYQQTLIKDNAVMLDKRHFTNSVTMSRIYPESDKDRNVDRLEEMNDMIDAILKVVTKQHNVPSFRLIETAQLMLNYKDNPIQLTNDIFIKVESINLNAEGFIGRIDITLMSNTLSASDISKYIKHVYSLHKEELRNALGDTVYYFDQKAKNCNVSSDPRTTTMRPDELLKHKQMMIQSAPKFLSFTKAPFISNKSFNNIFGDGVRTIENRILFFLKNKTWYDNRGIPYQLGLMMSGAPGTGKTSIIRAIANLTKRHIINVNFANIQSATQLKNLFQAEKLSVYTDSTFSEINCFHIPIDQRIYVLEEIDTIGDIVKQRVNINEKSHQSTHDEVTLGEILTVLDGTMETPGRIVIMTSNHPELLDEALIRPGRIDVMVKFERANKQTISEMFSAFYDENMNHDEIDKLPDNMLTPAEVGQVLFQHFDDDKLSLINKVIVDLNATAKENEQVKIKRENAQRFQAENNAQIKKSKKRHKSNKPKNSKNIVSLDSDSIFSSGSVSEYSTSSDSNKILNNTESSPIINPSNATTQVSIKTSGQKQEYCVFPDSGMENLQTSHDFFGPVAQDYKVVPTTLDQMYAPLSSGIKVL